MAEPLIVLIVEDSEDDARLLVRHLERADVPVEWRRVDDEAALRAALGEGGCDVVLADYGLPRMDFFDAVAIVHEHDPDLPVIAVSGSIGEERTAEVLRAGVRDVVVKGHLARLQPAIERELEEAANRRAKRQAQAQLALSEARFRDFAGSSSDWFWETDTEQRFTYFVYTGETALWGDDASRNIGKTRRQVHREVGATEDIIGEIARRMEKGEAFRDLEYRACSPSKGERWVQFSGVPVRDAEGRIVAYRGTGRDVTALKRAEMTMRESEERLRTLASNVPGLVYQRVLRSSGEIEHTFLAGRLFEEFAAKGGTPDIGLDVIHPDDRADFESALRDSAASMETLDQEIRVEWRGEERWLRSISTPRQGETGEVVWDGIAVDITDQKRAEGRLDYLAWYDELTGLPNRALFCDRLVQALARVGRAKRSICVVVVDLDGFSVVNDSRGRMAGDTIIKATATRLAQQVRSGDTVAREAANRFLILSSDMAHGEDASLVMRKLAGVFDEPFVVDGEEIRFTASLGASIYPDDSSEADTLIGQAEAALYRAKKEGKAQHRFYTPALTAATMRLISIERELRAALERGELKVVYQPLVASRSYDLVGLEALVRWQHPDHGLLAPGQFMDVAEDTGLVEAVGERVIAMVVRDIKAWQAAGRGSARTAVNLSAREFVRPKLAERLLALLDGLDPRCLEVELTEHTILQDMDNTRATMAELAEAGIGVAIDDFGTGYSSLSYVANLPFRTLKIDRSFVAAMARERQQAAIVNTVATLGRNLGKRVVAEGVETKEQLIYLEAYHVDVLQGFLFGRPTAADQISGPLKDRVIEPGGSMAEAAE